mmetsp:Transcript_6226/g.25913  ORF Transcript_6226/g.25913 Transcript_6226/m.25913 type:complete len:205 (+) Transcript_6226:781-1395(+)
MDQTTTRSSNFWWPSDSAWMSGWARIISPQGVRDTAIVMEPRLSGAATPEDTACLARACGPSTMEVASVDAPSLGRKSVPLPTAETSAALSARSSALRIMASSSLVNMASRAAPGGRSCLVSMGAWREASIWRQGRQRQRRSKSMWVEPSTTPRSTPVAMPPAAGRITSTTSSQRPGIQASKESATPKLGFAVRRSEPAPPTLW